MLKNTFTFSRFTLLVALSISVIAAYYSVKGLTTIFAGAVTEIIVMGTILEIAKVTTTVWLHRYWHRAGIATRAYLSTAVVVLALLTSMGVFGLLSKAHVDQGLISGDVSAQVALLDEKIKTQRDNIAAARAALQQMDEQVNQRLSRGTSENSAERSVQIRRQQAAERTRLQNEIAAAQDQINKLNEQRAPIASQLRTVEAEVGPIKYIAALIYGDNPDTATLERAVRWVTILIVLVFDPLAIILILAANNSMRWDRERNNPTPEPIQETVEESNQIEKELVQESVQEPEVQQAELVESSVQIEQTVDEDIPEPSGIGYDEDDKTKEKVRYFSTQSYVPFGGKSISIAALREIRPDLILSEEERNKQVINFDTKFPYEAVLGELFIKVDRVPHELFKFNGRKWMPINKNQNTAYLENKNYLRYLIKKLDKEEYDASNLTIAEQNEISNYLKQN
jgi:uncharacterized membrane protein (DUF441 family)